MVGYLRPLKKLGVSFLFYEWPQLLSLVLTCEHLSLTHSSAQQMSQWTLGFLWEHGMSTVRG